MSVALVAGLALVSVAFGAGAPGLLAHLSDVGAWLGSASNGTVVHANGFTGKVDGRVQLTSANGHPLEVVQRGTSAYVIDRKTGVVSRIDPAQLAVNQAHGYGADDDQLVIGPNTAYVLDPTRGVVQRIDPVTLATVGVTISLTAPLGSAAMDDQQTLWIPVPANGQVIPVRGGRAGTPVKVGGPHDPLLLTMAAGTPVVTDPSRGTTTVVASTGGKLQVNLPAEVASPAAPVLTPAATDGHVVPILQSGQDAMALIDTMTGGMRTVALDAGGHRLGAPQVLGDRTFVPDETTGRLIVYNSAAAQFEEQIPVTGHPGNLETFVKDGLLWVNDDNSAQAAVVNPDGGVQHVGKYATDIPGAPRSNVPAPPSPAPKSNGQAPVPQRTPTPTPVLQRTPTPVPVPQAPGTVTAASGPGWIDVTFTPSPGGTPSGYGLVANPADGSAQPAQIPPSGPFTFHVVGGSCDSQYTFRVTALYPGGQVPSQPSIPVRPCVAPGAPQSFQATPMNHGASLRWAPPLNAGGARITYSVSWSGQVAGTQSSLTSTSTQVSGLVNGGQYQFTLVGADGAGSGQAPATATASLVPPDGVYSLHNNFNAQGLPLNVRTAPSTSAPVYTSWPNGHQQNVAVMCQAKGDYYQDPTDPGLHGDVWDQIAPTAWVVDIYVATPQSSAGNFSAFSDPPLWQCT